MAGGNSRISALFDSSVTSAVKVFFSQIREWPGVTVIDFCQFDVPAIGALCNEPIRDVLAGRLNANEPIAGNFVRRLS